MVSSIVWDLKTLQTDMSVFLSSFHIGAKPKCALWLQLEVDDTWVKMNSNEYDLINNSVVTNDDVLYSIYKTVELRVATTEDELSDSQSDLSIVASINAEIVTVAGLDSEVVTVAGIETEILSIYADKVKLDSLYADKTTLDSLYADKAILDSLYADKVTLDSLYADKTQLDAIYANLTEILLADDNAAIATAKALEASASATEASNSADEAEAFKDEAAVSAASVDTGLISNTSVLTNGAIDSDILSIVGGDSKVHIADGKAITYTKGKGQANTQETTTSAELDLASFAGSTAYILKELGNPAIGSSAGMSVGQSRGTIVGPYLNTLDKVVYDGSDVATELVAIGEVKVDSQGNTFEVLEYEPLKSYFNDVYANEIEANGLLSANANVKIVDFGTIYNNNRYVDDNPFGNENYEGCDVTCQVYTNGMWSDPKWFTYDTGSGRGVTAHSNEEGVVVQTGGVNVWENSPQSGSGHGSSGAGLTSAPCRVIVTYNGKAK